MFHIFLSNKEELQTPRESLDEVQVIGSNGKALDKSGDTEILTVNVISEVNDFPQETGQSEGVVVIHRSYSPLLLNTEPSGSKGVSPSPLGKIGRFQGLPSSSLPQGKKKGNPNGEQACLEPRPFLEESSCEPLLHMVDTLGNTSFLLLQLKKMEDSLSRQLEENLDRRFSELANWETGSHRSWRERTPSPSPEKDGEAPQPDQRDDRFPSPRGVARVVPAQERPSFQPGHSVSSAGFAPPSQTDSQTPYRSHAIEEEFQSSDLNLPPSNIIDAEPRLLGDEEDSEWGPWREPKGDDRIILSLKGQSVTFVETNGDYTTFDSSKVQVEMGEWRPRYRFRKVLGTLAPTRIQSAILSAREAYDDFCKWAHKHSKVSLARQAFQPHNRAFSLPPKGKEVRWTLSLPGRGRCRSSAHLQEIGVG